MFEKESLTHHIQRHIMQALMYREYARFRDLRPPRVDSNLFNYHLKLLIQQGYVAKESDGYTLSRKGLLYVDRVNSAKMQPRTQPKIITMLFVQDNRGRVLLQRRTKQPYINTWTLPYGKLHIDDASLFAAATREASDKLQIIPKNMQHRGDCYIRVQQGGTVDSTTLAHLVQLDAVTIPPSESLLWVAPAGLVALRLAPAVQQIIEQLVTGSNYFFAEYTIMEAC